MKSTELSAAALSHLKETVDETEMARLYKRVVPKHLRNRYSGAKLRELRAQRGVGPRRKLKFDPNKVEESQEVPTLDQGR